MAPHRPADARCGGDAAGIDAGAAAGKGYAALLARPSQKYAQLPEAHAALHRGDRRPAQSAKFDRAAAEDLGVVARLMISLVRHVADEATKPGETTASAYLLCRNFCSRNF